MGGMHLHQPLLVPAVPRVCIIRTCRNTGQTLCTSSCRDSHAICPLAGECQQPGPQTAQTPTSRLALKALSFSNPRLASSNPGYSVPIV